MYMHTFCWAENLVWSKGLKSFSPDLLFVCVRESKTASVYVWVCIRDMCVSVMCVSVRVHLHTSAGRSYACYEWLVSVQQLILMCAMTHSYVCNDSLVCVP